MSDRIQSGSYLSRRPYPNILKEREGALKMGEKGNLPDTLQDVFANLAEQGPQFWLGYEQFKQSQVVVAREPAAAEAGATAGAVSEVVKAAVVEQPVAPAAE